MSGEGGPRKLAVAGREGEGEEEREEAEGERVDTERGRSNASVHVHINAAPEVGRNPTHATVEDEEDEEYA